MLSFSSLCYCLTLSVILYIALIPAVGFIRQSHGYQSWFNCRIHVSLRKVSLEFKFHLSSNTLAVYGILYSIIFNNLETQIRHTIRIEAILFVISSIGVCYFLYLIAGTYDGRTIYHIKDIIELKEFASILREAWIDLILLFLLKWGFDFNSWK